MIYKRSKKTYGEDVIVIPLTSVKETKQSLDEFDVEIFEGVQTPSLAKLRQIRCVSKKRMGQWIGKINNPTIQDLIEMKLLAML